MSRTHHIVLGLPYCWRERVTRRAPQPIHLAGHCYSFFAIPIRHLSEDIRKLDPHYATSGSLEGLAPLNQIEDSPIWKDSETGHWGIRARVWIIPPRLRCLFPGRARGGTAELRPVLLVTRQFHEFFRGIRGLVGLSVLPIKLILLLFQ